MVILEDASHEHHIEKTEIYLKIVHDFLSRVERNSTDAYKCRKR